MLKVTISPSLAVALPLTMETLMASLSARLAVAEASASATDTAAPKGRMAEIATRRVSAASFRASSAAVSVISAKAVVMPVTGGISSTPPAGVKVQSTAMPLPQPVTAKSTMAAAPSSAPLMVMRNTAVPAAPAPPSAKPSPSCRAMAAVPLSSSVMETPAFSPMPEMRPPPPLTAPRVTSNCSAASSSESSVARIWISRLVCDALRVRLPPVASAPRAGCAML